MDYKIQLIDIQEYFMKPIVEPLQYQNLGWVDFRLTGGHGGRGVGPDARDGYGTPLWNPWRAWTWSGPPLEQAAQSVVRQLGTGASDGGWGEVIRSVELPPLPELREGELGSLVLGDWIQLISPTMMELSATSWKWWEEVLQKAVAS